MNMKILLLAFISLFISPGCSDNKVEIEEETPVPGEPQEPVKNQKILIVYFSHTGNTKTIAGYINEAVESDIVEIKTVDTYTDDYDTLLAQIRQEVASGYSPPINTTVENVQDYDVIFIGYPIWVETAAPPIRTFLSSHDLSGKTVIPFCISGTSSAERSYQFVRSLCPQSTFLGGLQIRRSTYDTAKVRVLEWLGKIKVLSSGN